MKYLLWGDTFTCFKFENAKEEKKVLGKLLFRRPEITEAFTHPTIETPAIAEECLHIFDEREENPRCKKCGRKAFTHQTMTVASLKSSDFVSIDSPSECINHIWDERKEFPKCKKCGCFYPGFGGNNVNKNTGHY